MGQFLVAQTQTGESRQVRDVVTGDIGHGGHRASRADAVGT
jgi:hypothetical protein